MHKERKSPPRGERGLKLQTRGFPYEGLSSLPPRGAWIEILSYLSAISYNRGINKSLPPRGAWIEIPVHILGEKR